jgi:pheromone shutdown protein TraB
MSIHIFGIRHHGPGSAQSLRQALEALSPDCVLVEGPPDAANVLSLLVHQEMQPPVALLLYVPDKPEFAVYYPFAVFSPEWQALEYALRRNIPVQFMDLPQAHCLANWVEKADKEKAENASPAQDEPTAIEQQERIAEQDNQGNEQAEESKMSLRIDPITVLAEAAGYSDSERWWEHMVEHRRDSQDLFAAILEAMTALRQDLPPENDKTEMQREAFMRQTIRAAEREGYQRIAVVCGAWHAPALAEMPTSQRRRSVIESSSES